jgi:uncharacterized RDD family membrane protein YckC
VSNGPSVSAPQAYRGEALGLPAAGPGSLAPTGSRLLAFLVDALASALVAALFVSHHGDSFADRLPGSWSLIPLAVDYVGGILLTGRTIGMYLLGLRVVRMTAGNTGNKGNTGNTGNIFARVDVARVALRTALLFLLVPAVVFDRDGRGLHDRLTDTAVVRG